MPSFNTQLLLDDLTADVQQTLSAIAQIEQLDMDMLNTQPQSGKWSVAQVIEHLNSYNRYYLPEMKKALQSNKAKALGFNPIFKAGWFGNYFTNMMLPEKDGKVGNKMSSPKDHRPASQLEVARVITDFKQGQQQLLQYLKQASKINIGKLRVPISLSRFIKLKLGDTFRFLIAHQQRHFVQINNTIAALNINPVLVM